MNKQQLATKIWESANQMRSKIEANEYKDYILGFIFYKYLSEKQIQFARKEDFTEEDIKALKEEDTETVEFIKKNIGYFIAYEDLFGTWISAGKDFDVSDVRESLSAFSRLISPKHKKLFDGIFNTLETGLSKLGDTAAKQTKAIADLLHLIKDIPMDSKQDYDVLGFIYEYLIEKFAANAGKKAGEFYTPHEVSVLMSEIISDHLKDRKHIEIYDSCSGSGSLLINIGHSIAKYMDDQNNIKYYAQELKQNTYNLTRMNLVMRGILPANIQTRNGDTLEDDWPFFDENDPVHTYDTLYLDAVVSNPPYSQKWTPTNKEADPRYARFGLAPKTKADFAFLLHDLYHLKPDGIMNIVLPHGVLFRGGEEGRIREQLIEKNHIDAIIGMPSGIFFGTGIPTVIIVLRQKRSNTDILFIDASKGFVKDGKNNKLRARDIRQIADAVRDRATIPKFSRTVERDEIRNNEYNLNIPRYVDSSETTEKWDIYAAMFGGIPVNEIDELNFYWDAFPELRKALFERTTAVNAKLKVDSVGESIVNHPNVTAFKEEFTKAFLGFDQYLIERLVNNTADVKVTKEKTTLSNDIFKRLESIPLIDKYEAYQLLDDNWQTIRVDLEILQTEGFSATRVVEPNIVVKKKNGKDTEVQEGWKGRIMTFSLVQEIYLIDELKSLTTKENRLTAIATEIEELVEALPEEVKDSSLLNDKSDAFVAKELNESVKEAYEDVETPEINALKAYQKLLDNKARKPEKEAFIETNKVIQWSAMNANKDGTYSKTAVNKYLSQLQSVFTFKEDTFEYQVVKANQFLIEQKDLKAQIKKEATALHMLTKDTIEKLSDAQVKNLLEHKWVQPFANALDNLPTSVLNILTLKLQQLENKYSTTYSDLAKEIKHTENELAGLLDDLTGNEHDIIALREFKNLLKTNT